MGDVARNRKNAIKKPVPKSNHITREVRETPINRAYESKQKWLISKDGKQAKIFSSKTEQQLIALYGFAIRIPTNA